MNRVSRIVMIINIKDIRHLPDEIILKWLKDTNAIKNITDSIFNSKVSYDR